MKRILTNIIYHALLLPAGITYFVVDYSRSVKKRKKSVSQENKNQNVHTVYPDEQPPFNDWINGIFNQRK